MRKLYAVLIAAGLAFAVAGQASAITVNLNQIGGTYAGGGGPPTPTDTVVLDIQVVLGAAEATNGVSFAFDLTNCGGCSFIGGSEAPFNFINGVVLTPIIGGGPFVPGVAPNTIKGWEATTLTPGGAPGPATFSIGTATFHLNGPGTLSAGGSVGTDTQLLDGNNQPVGGTLNGFAFIPEPTTFAMLGLGLAGLAWAGRRES